MYRNAMVDSGAPEPEESSTPTPPAGVREPRPTPSGAVTEETERTPARRVVRYAVVAATTFAVSLVITETPGEIALDVDLKPFFVPYLLIAALGYGLRTFSVAIGAAVGEGVIDVFEGYELDDPIGFLSFGAGFVLFGWYLHRVADDPARAKALTIAAVFGAFVQASFEGFAYYVFGPASTMQDAVLSVLGNTITHGVVFGAIPLVLLAPVLVPWLRSTLTPRL